MKLQDWEFLGIDRVPVKLLRFSLCVKGGKKLFKPLSGVVDKESLRVD